MRTAVMGECCIVLQMSNACILDSHGCPWFLEYGTGHNVQYAGPETSRSQVQLLHCATLAMW